MGVILTMNAPLSMYEAHYRDVFEARLNLSRTLNGSVEFLPACDTLQVSDYSRYSMAGFDEARKRAVRETQFPLDMRRAFDLGARLSAAKG